MKAFIGKAVKLGIIFAIFGLNSTAFAAPRIPKELRNESLVYCTGVLGFSFNPQKADVGTNMNVVTEQIYDKLFEFDAKSNSLKPALAERFSVSDDGKVITLHLRRKVAFHTTSWFTPTRNFNAEDVVFSLNRIIGYVEELPALDFTEGGRAAFRQNQHYAYQFKANLAHYPYFESVALKNKIKKITAPNDYTVKIHLVEADNSVLAHLASQYAVILSKEYALQLNADENLAQLDLLPIGTGVYQLNDYVANEYVRLKPHNKYWGKKAHIPNMVVDVSTNSAGRIAKYLNRECDVVALPEPSQLSVVTKEEVVETSGANLAFLAFNTQKSRMQDVQFRRKIAQAINRERIADVLFYGAAQVAQNTLPPLLFPTKNHDGYPYQQPEIAGENSEKFDRLQLWVPDESRVYNLHPQKMAELIRADLAKIGIEVEIKPVSRAYVAQFAEVGKADYDMILTGWLANNLDPNAFLTPILACRSQNELTNLANWCNPEFDRWLEMAKGSEQPYVRHLLYRLVQNILEQQLPILPLVNGNRVLLVNSRVENAQVTPFGQVRLADLKLKHEEK
ncbi:ABC transporter substrate-binding protein [Actinobacillus equuli subsp. haemolyticus]|nr:ABC transporter substrate-binding protein [Actinobacillus equuli subsp. haemolyticus]